MRAPRLEHGLWLLAGSVLFLSFGYTEMAGSDLWWHIAAGRELLQTGTLWMVDDWSFSAHGHDWLNHEWLSDIIYYSWVSAFGIQSLAYWKWLVVISTYLLLQYSLARTTGSWAAGFLCAGMALLVGAPFIDVRPHLYTLLCLSLLVFLLLGRRAPTWQLALLFLVWVNLHGGFFFGLMALGILLFPWRELNWDNFRGAFLVGLVCLAAALVNPTGYETFLYPLKYAFDSSSPFRELGEWLSPFDAGGIISPMFFVFMWFPLAGLAYLIPAVRRETGIPWEGLMLTALTLAMSLTSRRFIPIFGISLAVMLAPLLGYLLGKLRAERYGVILAVLALAVALVRQWPYPIQAAPAFHYLTAEYSYPVDIVDLVERNDIKGDVFAYYNWGGYLHLRTDGALRVYIDGRADTIYNADHYNSYVAVLRSDPNWLEVVNASGADYFLWPLQIADGQAKLQAMWQTRQWKLVYRDSTGYLLARNEVPIPKTLKAPSATVSRLLTLGYERFAQGENDEAREFAASALRREPWHRSACLLAMAAFARAGEDDRAAEVAADCYRQFPTPIFSAVRKQQ